MVGMMSLVHLLKLIDVYAAALSIEDKTVSFRVFGDSKKVTALRDGADITVGRFNAALAWFAANWPDAAEWPATVARPELVEAQA